MVSKTLSLLPFVCVSVYIHGCVSLEGKLYMFVFYLIEENGGIYVLRVYMW